MVFVGLDWASTAHAVCVLDSIGAVQWRGSVPHSAEGLAELGQPYDVTRHRAATLSAA
jgi:Transposase